MSCFRNIKYQADVLAVHCNNSKSTKLNSNKCSRGKPQSIIPAKCKAFTASTECTSQEHRQWRKWSMCHTNIQVSILKGSRESRNSLCAFNLRISAKYIQISNGTSIYHYAVKKPQHIASFDTAFYCGMLHYGHCLFPFLCTDLSWVELELFAFEDVTISASTLAGSGGDARWNTGDRTRITQRIQLIYLHLFTDCFMKISPRCLNKYSIGSPLSTLPHTIPEHIWITRSGISWRARPTKWGYW